MAKQVSISLVVSYPALKHTDNKYVCIKEDRTLHKRLFLITSHIAYRIVITVNKKNKPYGIYIYVFVFTLS